MPIFMSPFGQELLNSSKYVYADGTCPPPFSQVYVVFGETRQKRAVTTCSGLLPDKRTGTYTLFWAELKLTKMLPLFIVLLSY